MLKGVVATGFSLWCQLPRHRLRLGVEIRSIASPTAWLERARKHNSAESLEWGTGCSADRRPSPIGQGPIQLATYETWTMV